MPASEAEGKAPRLSWREGLYLVGPDPLTSPYYSSGALLVAGVGYATPAFQIGLYSLLFLLAPLYVEAVLLTLSNGGTYVMTRYALSHLGKLAVGAAALVGIVISFSYVATAIVSLLSYSNYVRSLVPVDTGLPVLAAVGLSTLPSVAFGIWVMPAKWRSVVGTVLASSAMAVVLSTVMPEGAVVMLPPLVMLFTLNNEGLRESVQVSKTIFLINLVVMGITILFGLIYLALHGADTSGFAEGAAIQASESGGAHTVEALPGFAQLEMPLVLAGIGASILGASGVESVMNIPEELERPRRDVARIYRWMLSILLVVGGSLTLLLFLVLTPEELAHKASYLLAALGARAVGGATGSEGLGTIWQTVIVANAALMLIGATNTGFAGARGLWLTMARDSLLPRLLLAPNERGAFHRVHWLMLVAIFLLATEAGWDLPKLERWYGATFGLVMFSGMIAFILLRRFKAEDRRVYWAPFNVRVLGTRVPIGALIGVVVLGYALLSMWASYRGDIGELRELVITVGVLVGCVLLVYNHRPLIRAGFEYFRGVVETVENTAIETEDRTIVVAVGGVRTGRLLQKATTLARRQSRTTGIPYRQLVVLHVTPTVRREHVYRVHSDSIRPAGIEGPAVRIFNTMTELDASEMSLYLALVPPRGGDRDELHQALDALVQFHDEHNFRGHMVMVGTYALGQSDLGDLQARLEGSTLVPVQLFGED